MSGHHVRACEGSGGKRLFDGELCAGSDYESSPFVQPETKHKCAFMFSSGARGAKKMTNGK